MRTPNIVITLAVTALVLLALTTASHADQMTFEGTLTGPDGLPAADGAHAFDFALFSTPTDGSLLWAETHAGVPVHDGLYSIVLGAHTVLDLPAGSYWLQVTVDGEVLEPRTKVLLTEGDCTITGNLMLDGNLGVGTATPAFPLHIDQDNLASGIRTVWGSDCTTCYGEFKVAQADGLVINSNTGGSWAEIRFQNNGTTNMYLSHDGKLGIGTDAPGTALEVWGDGRFGDWDQAATVQGSRLQVHNATGTGKSFLVTHYAFPSSTAFVIEGGGDVGIGIENPTHLLDVGTSGAYCDGGAWVNGSSRAFKDNIVQLSLEQALQTLQALVPSSFTYKDGSSETYLGFIAEDVPDLVATVDHKGLVAMDFVAVLTKVVQAQQSQIEELENVLQTLRQP